MKEMINIDVKLMQFDRKTCKCVEYTPELDEGVFFRYVVNIYLSRFPISVELKDCSMFQDLSIEWFEDKHKTERQPLCEKIKLEITEKVWDFILSNYPVTSKYKEIFDDYMKFIGESVFKAIRLKWDCLDEDTKNDIREKNQIKYQDVEICLNEVVKE